MIRRYSAGRDPSQNYLHRPGAYAVILEADRCLLTYQHVPGREWQLPGGGLDEGETAPAALRREVIEETGWKVATVRRLGAFRRFAYMPEYGFWAEKLCHIYLARALRRIGPPSESGHLARWVPIATATRLLANEGDASFLRLAAMKMPVTRDARARNAAAGRQADRTRTR